MENRRVLWYADRVSIEKRVINDIKKIRLL